MPEVGAAIAAARIVPVLVLDNARQAAAVADALVAGGLPIAEVTFRTDAAREAIGVMAGRGNILVGAGTVLEPQQVDLAVEAGARFIVSPGTSRAVIQRCADHGVLALPGAVTASEVQAAREMGLRSVKFFPADTAGGTAAIRALAAPFRDMTFIPTGGIGPTNLVDYLDIPAVSAVGGSWMVPRQAIGAGQFATVTELAAQAVALAHEGESR